MFQAKTTSHESWPSKACGTSWESLRAPRILICRSCFAVLVEPHSVQKSTFSWWFTLINYYLLAKIHAFQAQMLLIKKGFAQVPISTASKPRLLGANKILHWVHLHPQTRGDVDPEFLQFSAATGPERCRIFHSHSSTRSTRSTSSIHSKNLHLFHPLKPRRTLGVQLGESPETMASFGNHDHPWAIHGKWWKKPHA